MREDSKGGRIEITTYGRRQLTQDIGISVCFLTPATQLNNEEGVGVIFEEGKKINSGANLLIAQTEITKETKRKFKEAAPIFFPLFSSPRDGQL